VPRITRTRTFLAAVAGLTLLLGLEIHRSDLRHLSQPAVDEDARPRVQPDSLLPQNPARCPDGAASSHGVPRKIADRAPVYPAAARERGVSGVVIVQLLIDTRGEVAAAKVIRSVPELDEAAIDAVRHWKYTPTLLNGAAACVGMTVTVAVRP
jgi:TonB family protein